MTRTHDVSDPGGPLWVGNLPHPSNGGPGSIVASIGAVPENAPVLAAVEPARWDGLLRRAGVRDVYYSRGLVEASALLAEGEPTLLHRPGAAGDVLFPCIVRRDPADVVTPYGYGGPLGAGAAPPLAEFAAEYEAWCRERGIVTSFAVFHPLLGNADSPAASGFRRSALAGTVAWPLAGDLLAGMHKHHRRVVRGARAAGLQVAVDPAPSDLAEFVAVYERTMRRSGAAPFYRFPGAYWEALLEGVPLVRVDVRDGGRLLASVLGMGEPPWLHYHLGGTADAGRAAGASHLALFELARWGQEHGYETLHLGGGVGGREDSLMEFKQRFAPAGRAGVSIGRAVHDEARYLELAGTAAIDWDGFFPAYRSPR
jgi:serine/alanine adding enzyme